MRTQVEIESLVRRLEAHNEAISKQVRLFAAEDKRFDELARVFNGNGQLLCILKWVLGEDTIRVTAEAERRAG